VESDLFCDLFYDVSIQIIDQITKIIEELKRTGVKVERKKNQFPKRELEKFPANLHLTHLTPFLLLKKLCIFIIIW
jgi:hypothetical protein